MPVVRPSWLTRAAAQRPRRCGRRRRARRSSGLQQRRRRRPRRARSRSRRPSNAWQRPSGESIDALQKPIVGSGVRISMHAADERQRRTRPPASARSARCAAVSEDEHAVSTVTLGPRRSKTYEIRFAAMLDGAAAVRVRVDQAAVRRVHLHVAVVVRRERRRRRPCASRRAGRARCPPSSIASCATSSSRRCCGSMRLASRGEMPKKAASKRSTSVDEPAPAACTSSPGARGRGRRRARGRTARAGPRGSRRRRRAAARQKRSGESAPPGKRQPMPTIAIAPLIPASSVAHRSSVLLEPRAGD